jgi:hypothetical protein
MDGLEHIFYCGRAFAHPVKRFAAEHEAMRVSQRPDPATAICQAIGRRPVAACERSGAQHFQSLVMRLREEFRPMQCHAR